MSRSFKNLSGSDPGRYISTNPQSAARKAGSAMLKKQGTTGAASFVVTIQETTQGSQKKVYKYKYERMYNGGREIRKNGKNILFNWDIKTTSLN